MSVSILVVDDEADVAGAFRQRFRHQARDRTYVMHFANSGEEALQQLTKGIDPNLIVILSDINLPARTARRRGADGGAARLLTRGLDHRTGA